MRVSVFSSHECDLGFPGPEPTLGPSIPEEGQTREAVVGTPPREMKAEPVRPEARAPGVGVRAVQAQAWGGQLERRRRHQRLS